MTETPWADRVPTWQELADLIDRANKGLVDPPPAEKRRLDEAIKRLQKRLNKPETPEPETPEG
jgi:hypothetical protein